MSSELWEDCKINPAREWVSGWKGVCKLYSHGDHFWFLQGPSKSRGIVLPRLQENYDGEGEVKRKVRLKCCAKYKGLCKCYCYFSNMNPSLCEIPTYSVWASVWLNPSFFFLFSPPPHEPLMMPLRSCENHVSGIAFSVCLPVVVGGIYPQFALISPCVCIKKINF